MISHLVTFVALSLVMTGCSGEDLTDLRSHESKPGSDAELSLAKTDEISANVEAFYATISVGRDGPLVAACRMASFRVVSDQPLKLVKTYKTEGNQDSATQEDANTILVKSTTTVGRDGILVLANRNASLRIEDDGVGLKNCPNQSNVVEKSLAMDLSANLADGNAPSRHTKYGRHRAFARVQKFFLNRYSLRANFRIAGLQGDQLDVND